MRKERFSPKDLWLPVRDLPQKLLVVFVLVVVDGAVWAGLLLAAACIHGAVGSTNVLRLAGMLWWVPVVGITFHALSGLYTKRRPYWDEVRALWRACTTAHLAVLPSLLYAWALGLLPVSPGLIATSWILELLVLPVLRPGVKRALGHFGLWRKRVLLLGTEEAAAKLLCALERDTTLGYEVVRILDSRAFQGQTTWASKGDPAALGSELSVKQAFIDTDARDVVIAMPGLSEHAVKGLVNELQAWGTDLIESIRIVPLLGFLSLMEFRIDQLLPERLFMMTFSDNLAKPWNACGKRLLDLLLAGILLLVASPAAVLIGALIRLDSPGRALYPQQRLGQGGRAFLCLKFRTMHRDSESRLGEVLNSNPEAKAEWEMYRKLKTADPRITRIGRFLRRWSLDELPQLLNVLKGDMSLVGPRPYLPEERGEAGTDLVTIHQTKPGITGLWQVTGKNELPFSERVQIEAWYVRNWSMWLDLIVMVRTVRTVLVREGAY